VALLAHLRKCRLDDLSSSPRIAEHLVGEAVELLGVHIEGRSRLRTFERSLQSPGTDLELAQMRQ
jgi:hypothetical protein